MALLYILRLIHRISYPSFIQPAPVDYASDLYNQLIMQAGDQLNMLFSTWLLYILSAIADRRYKMLSKPIYAP